MILTHPNEKKTKTKSYASIQMSVNRI